MYKRLKLRISIFRVKRRIQRRFKNLFRLSNRLKRLGREVALKTHWNYGDLHFYTANVLAHNLHKIESINTLVAAGLSSDAWPIYRGVIESALDYDYLYKNPAKLKLYFEYSTYLDLKRIERRMITHPFTDEQTKQYENLKAEWKKVESKFVQGNRTRLAWRDKSLSEIAKDAKMELVYTTAYQEANDYTHGNSNLIQNFFKGKDAKGLYLKGGATYEGHEIYLILSGSGLMYLHILFIANHKFKLGMEKKLEKLRADYVAFPFTRGE